MGTGMDGRVRTAAPVESAADAQPAAALRERDATATEAQVAQAREKAFRAERYVTHLEPPAP